MSFPFPRQSILGVLYANDPNEIPLADIEAAYDMPYDTDIPEDDADIPNIKVRYEEQFIHKLL